MENETLGGGGVGRPGEGLMPLQLRHGRDNMSMTAFHTGYRILSNLGDF